MPAVIPQAAPDRAVAPLAPDLRAYARDVLSVLSWRAALLVASTLAITLLEGLGLALLAPLLSHVGLEAGEGPMSRIALGVRAAYDALGVPVTLATLLASFLALTVAQALVRRAHALYAYRQQQAFIAHLRARLYRALLRADWRFFVRNRGSDFLHKLIRELENVGGATFNLLDWFVGVVLTLVYVGFALYLSPTMTGLVLTAGALLSLALWTRTRAARDRGSDLSDAYAGLFDALSEHLQGMKTAKSHGVEARHAELFLATTREVERAQVGVLANQQATAFWFRVGSMAVLALTLYVAVDVAGLAPATLAVLLYVFSRLIPRLSQIQSGYQAFLAHIPSYARVRDLERRCAEAAESSAFAPAPRLERALAYEGVSFAFEPGDPPIVADVDLVLRAGATTAIVGPSGAGKSTLADLAVGLLRPTRGRLTIDGVPLEDDMIASWRARIGYVAQDTFVFHDSLRANLALTRPEASDAELEAALALAAADFLHGLPAGLDTVLGDRGVRLSGGERQRLALARALLREPDLLILDEATSALDAENEARIQSALHALQGRTTILLIAHRLATVRRADRIHVLEGGHVVETGTWETLMAVPGGRFRALAEAQGLAAGAAVMP